MIPWGVSPLEVSHFHGLSNMEKPLHKLSRAPLVVVVMLYLVHYLGHLAHLVPKSIPHALGQSVYDTTAPAGARALEAVSHHFEEALAQGLCLTLFGMDHDLAPQL